MRRALFYFLSLTALVSTATAHGDNQYFGIGGAYFTGATAPIFSFHTGYTLSSAIEVRGALDTLASIIVVSGDVLYTLYPDSILKVYVGLGPDLLVILVDPIPRAAFEFHTTTGVEYRRTSNLGIYLEARPFLVSTLNRGVLAIQFRGGVNVYF